MTGRYICSQGTTKTFTANIQCRKACAIEVRLDSKDGPVTGTLKLAPCDGFKNFSCRLSGAAGVHDLTRYQIVAVPEDCTLFIHVPGAGNWAKIGMKEIF